MSEEVIEREIVKRRLLEKVVRSGACWNWKGAKNTSDKRYTPYGQSWFKKKQILAHRLSYLLFVGSIEKGMTIDHICNNRLCVNPDHLRMMRLRDNILRGSGPSAMNAKKTHCPQGHLYTKENTKINSHGRACRICFNVNLKRRRAIKRRQKALAALQAYEGKERGA